MTTDLDQLRRTVRVLELLDESFRAHQAGDLATSDIAAARANEVDAFAVSGITGGMIIGEVPHPERDPLAWAEYVAVMHEKLAAEEDAAAQPPRVQVYPPGCELNGCAHHYPASLPGCICPAWFDSGGWHTISVNPDCAAHDVPGQPGELAGG